MRCPPRNYLIDHTAENMRVTMCNGSKEYAEMLLNVGNDVLQHLFSNRNTHYVQPRILLCVMDLYTRVFDLCLHHHRSCPHLRNLNFLLRQMKCLSPDTVDLYRSSSLRHPQTIYLHSEVMV